MRQGLLRNFGLILFAGLLVLLTGTAIWLGAVVPDAKSCLAIVSKMTKAETRESRAKALRACRNPRAT